MSISTSPAPGVGSGCSVSVRTSGPPYWVREIARTMPDGSRSVAAVPLAPNTTQPPIDPWPLRHLTLRTPRLTLRPDDDEGLYELAAVAVRGIHPPEQMPFAQPWTDQAPSDLVRGVMQHNWLGVPS